MAYVFVHNAINKSVDQYGSSITALKLLLPTVDGYAVRNDIIQRRFLTCDLAEEVANFTTLRQHIHAFNFGSENIFERALNDAVGAVQLNCLPSINKALISSAMASIEADVTARHQGVKKNVWLNARLMTPIEEMGKSALTPQYLTQFDAMEELSLSLSIDRDISESTICCSSSYSSKYVRYLHLGGSPRGLRQASQQG